MLYFSTILFFVTTTVATIGEGLSSSEPEAKINAGYRMFTTITGPEACSSTPRPVSFVTKPVSLVVGEELRLSDLGAAAYDASGKFIPSVPIEVLEKDASNEILIRDLNNVEYIWIAKEPGTKILLIRDICVGAGGAEADVLVTIEQIAR